MSTDILSRERFSDRHIGPDEQAISDMLSTLQEKTLEEFIDKVVPRSIRTGEPLHIGEGWDEHNLLSMLGEIATENSVWRSFIGMGYHNTITPPVIIRNILENPGWYTAYTPYQAEIAQGRLEALLNFQTMVIDLTAMEVANASLLDEGTAAAEAMHMFHTISGARQGGVFFVSQSCHPQTIAVLQTRAKPTGINVVVGDEHSFTFDGGVFGALLQYPTSDGAVVDYTAICDRVHATGGLVVVAADLLSLALLKPPGEFGADAAVGSTQRFGVPLGYGGPHAAYFATREQHKRFVPGRIIGLSIDSRGKPALRMALQTREQHIKREKATSNVCTAQVLLAVIAGMYAVYHGPAGIKKIATRIHAFTDVLARSLHQAGNEIVHSEYFDTLRIRPKKNGADIKTAAGTARVNLRYFNDGTIGISLDETTQIEDLELLLGIFRSEGSSPLNLSRLKAAEPKSYPKVLARTTPYLTHPVFNTHHSETEMLRYMHMLEVKDLALNVSMIPLGSCTMKLNATTEMIPITWGEFANIHPFVPASQARGYERIFNQLSDWLKDITGFDGVSLQPNAGAQGEYAGLLVIREYLASKGESARTVCLIPSSAHGTNPASAVMAGMQVVVVRCDENGNIDLKDLEDKARRHKDALAAFMVTYPSTHGVFEVEIKRICALIHENGGQVYMDGANMNAQVGLCRPAELGADVCHLNLHKTFCIPHGGGGPGMGPIAVAKHLVPFLPSHPVVLTGGENAIGPVSAAPWGSADILLISWAYIAMMGSAGLTAATKVAVLNANYMAKRLESHYPILYRGSMGRVAHEFIVDLRGFKEAGIEAEDVAKRLMDYGFHAPTVSFPVPGTLMIEPTESEPKEELDRFCDALISIRKEIQEIQEGVADRQSNVLKNAPHTAEVICSDEWVFPYGREKAAFPAPWTRAQKFWPSVGRVNNAYGDRNLVCACPPIEEYATVEEA